MKYKIILAGLLSLGLGAKTVIAQQDNDKLSFNSPSAAEMPSVSDLDVMDYTATKLKLQETLGLDVASIADAPIDGLLQVMTNRGIFYTSKDGKYFMQARIFNLDENMRNETEQAMTSLRIEGVAQFDDKAIEFKAKNERYVVNVFTDISCGYCQKLHNEIAQYNDLGITVRYLAFPRAGLGSQSYDELVAVWCAKDPKEALTVAKSGGHVTQSQCANSVAEQYSLGQRIGVAGTPYIVLPDGSLIGGYQPAYQLIQSLKQS